VRRACYGVVRFVMEASAKGVEVIVTGKLRGQRAKAMKFGDGYMIKTGHAGQLYTDTAVRHVLMRQGVIGIKVSIFLPHDPEGKNGGIKVPLDDVVTIAEPKEEINPDIENSRLIGHQQPLAMSDDVVPPIEESAF